MTWPLEALHRLRDARLRAVLRTAKERSQSHARRLADIDADTVTRDDLSMIPVMSKAEVMANSGRHRYGSSPDGRAAEAHLTHVAADGPAYLLHEYQVLTAGWSSGTRGVFVWDHDGLHMYALGRDRGTLSALGQLRRVW